MIVALAIIGAIIAGGFVAYSVIRPNSPVSKTDINSAPADTPSTEPKLQQQSQREQSSSSNNESEESNVAETPAPTVQLVKCLGADRKYSYVTQEVCDSTRRYWTAVLGSFPTDPEETIECLGADGKYSHVPRKVCEDTNAFWAAHRPPSASSNGSSKSSGNSSNTSSISSSSPDTSAPTIPGTPSTISPTRNNQPAWTWTASTDSGAGLAPAVYTVEWSQDSTFAAGVTSATSTTNTFTHASALTNGIWYLRVKFTDAAGNSSAYSDFGSVVISTPYLSDTFTDPDSTSLSSHVMAPVGIGNSWEVGSGTWQIQGNKAQELSAQGGSLFRSVYIDSGISDGEVEATLALGSSYSDGIIVRASSASDYWIAGMDTTIGGTYYIIKYENGLGTYMATKTGTGDRSGQTLTLKAVLRGHNIYFFVNGVLQVQYNQATFNQTATRHGLLHYTNGTTPSFDNFVVAQAPATAPAQAFTILLPTNYDQITAKHLVIYHHGMGETSTSILTDSRKTTLIQDLVSDGFIVAASDAHGNNWGNSASLADYEALHDYIRSNWQLDKIVSLSQSMGGESGLLSVAQNNIPYVAWAGIYPTANLANMYTVFPASVRAAFGIASDGSDYAAKTAGYDPVLLDGSLFDILYMRYYASPDDTTVNKTANSDQMSALVAGHAAENTVVLSSGKHGDTSHFQSQDLRNFYTRAINSTTPVAFSSGNVVDATTVSIEFTKPITSASSHYANGVVIKVDGVAATISSATLQSDNQTVHYSLSSPISNGQTVTFSYDSTVGDIKDSNNLALSTLTDQAVSNTLWWWLSGSISPLNVVAVYQPKGAASLAGSYSNLAQPGTYDATSGTDPSWDATNGWKFDRTSSQYLKTGVIPANGYTMVIKFSNASGIGTQWMAGVDSTRNARFYLSPNWSQTQRLYGSGAYAIISGTQTSGIMGIVGQQPYFNGLPDGNALAAWDTTQTREIFIGALHQANGTPGSYWTGYIQAVAIYSTTLTSGQISALNTAMSNL